MSRSHCCGAVQQPLLKEEVFGFSVCFGLLPKEFFSTFTEIVGFHLPLINVLLASHFVLGSISPISSCPLFRLKQRNHVLLAKTAKAEGPNPDRFGLLLVGCSIFSWANLSFSMWVEAEARKFFKPNLEVGAVDTIGTFLRST